VCHGYWQCCHTQPSLFTVFHCETRLLNHSVHFAYGLTQITKQQLELCDWNYIDRYCISICINMHDILVTCLQLQTWRRCLMLEVKSADFTWNNAIGAILMSWHQCSSVSPPPLPQTFWDALLIFIEARDSAIVIATRYGLDGPGIKSQWRRDLPYPFRPVLGPTQLPSQWVPGLSLG
jgi:hypothetical protein